MCMPSVFKALPPQSTHVRWLWAGKWKPLDGILGVWWGWHSQSSKNKALGKCCSSRKQNKDRKTTVQLHISSLLTSTLWNLPPGSFLQLQPDAGLTSRRSPPLTCSPHIQHSSPWRKFWLLRARPHFLDTPQYKQHHDGPHKAPRAASPRRARRRVRWSGIPCRSPPAEWGWAGAQETLLNLEWHCYLGY